MKYEVSAKRLKEAMNDKNLKAVDLAAKSGVGKSAISHYTSGRYCPHNKNAVALANVLNVNPLWLMGFDVPKPHPEKDAVAYDMALDIALDKKDNNKYAKIMEIMNTLDENKLEIALAYLQGLMDRW